MLKSKNIVFIISCLLMCSLAIGYKAASAFDVLPDALDNNRASYLEGRELEEFPELTLSALLDDSFQQNLEAHLSDSFPARDAVILTNATLERFEIEVASLPFSYEVYPTFLSSGFLYSKQHQALFELPYYADENEPLFEEAISALTMLVEENPLCQYVYYMPERSLISSSNPAMALVTDAMDHAMLKQHFVSKLPSEFVYLDAPIESTDEYLLNYFNSDLHWRINAAYDAYVAISDELGNDTLQIRGELVYPQFPFSGSLSRDGLMLLFNDYIVDYEIGYPDYELLVEGEIESRNNKQEFASGELEPIRYPYGGYSLYFGRQYEELIYTVPSNSDLGGNLLIVADSFSNSIELMLASSYENTYVLDPRFFSGSVSNYIKEHDIDDVVFIMGANSITNRGVLEALSQ